MTQAEKHAIFNKAVGFTVSVLSVFSERRFNLNWTGHCLSDEVGNKKAREKKVARDDMS